MKCPGCGNLENKVIDSRLSDGGEATRRRRECVACGRRYTTYERIEEVVPLIVKKDGRRESWDRRKLLQGLERACQKRPVSAEAREAVAEAIERELRESGEREVSSSEIGEKLMAHLRELDQVAYVRFASVYRQFDDIGEFLDELQRLGQRVRHSERLRVRPDVRGAERKEGPREGSPPDDAPHDHTPPDAAPHGNAPRHGEPLE
jgi:transcriptional repressor NrdR